MTAHRILQVEGLEPVVLALAERLWAVQRGDKLRTRLILPTKRDLFVRVSEQESKVLLCQVLEESDWHYSIETPTRETYVQTGLTPQSARCDLSLYRSMSPASLAVNVELKAHNPGVEAFRKDFEKLLREGADGLWVHTLLKSDARTVASIFAKMRDAFATESKHLAGRARKLTFAFVGLETQDLAVGTAAVGGEPNKSLETLSGLFEAKAIDAADGRWNTCSRRDDGTIESGVPFLHSVSRRGVGGGLRSAQLVYCPAIDPNAYLHLSVKGDSYYLRRYENGIVTKFRVMDAQSFSSLLKRYDFRATELATPEDRKHNIDEDVPYWQRRIDELNASLSGEQATA